MRFVVRCFRLEGMDARTLREPRRAGAEGLLVQTVREGLGSNELLFEMLAAQTFSNRDSGTLLTRKPEVDLLLRIAGTTQISAAMSRVGTMKGMPFVLIVAGTRKQVERFELGLGGAGARLERRSLSDGELAMVEDAALLDVVGSRRRV